MFDEFKKGDRVKCKFGEVFYYGSIKKKHKWGKQYTIEFDDGDIYVFKSFKIVKVDDVPLELKKVLKSMCCSKKEKCVDDVEDDCVSECSPRGISPF